MTSTPSRLALRLSRSPRRCPKHPSIQLANMISTQTSTLNPSDLPASTVLPQPRMSPPTPSKSRSTLIPTRPGSRGLLPPAFCPKNHGSRTLAQMVRSLMCHFQVRLELTVHLTAAREINRPRPLHLPKWPQRPRSIPLLRTPPRKHARTSLHSIPKNLASVQGLVT